MALPVNTPHNEVIISFPQLADIGTAGSVMAPCPVKGRLVRGYSLLGGAITGADSTWTVTVNTVAVTGTATVAFTASAAGDIDTVNFTGGNVGVKPGDLLTVVNAGESTGVATADFYLVVRV